MNEWDQQEVEKALAYFDMSQASIDNIVGRLSPVVDAIVARRVADVRAVLGGAA